VSEPTFDLVWMQRLGGGTETLERGIPASRALARLQQADREDYGAGGICFLRPEGEADPDAEIARLRAEMDDVMRAGDMEHARMAALIEACDAVAAFIESYAPDSPVAQLLPTFYANLRVYGKNARAAVEQVRAQADALLARLRDADALADAVAAYHDASRTAEIDPTMKPDEARRMYDLGRAWAAYEQTREARAE